MEKKEYEKLLRKLTKRVEEVEKEIGKWEREISEMDQRLSEPDNTLLGDTDFYTRYHSLKNELEEKMAEWGQYTHELEEFLKNG